MNLPVATLKALAAETADADPTENDQTRARRDPPAERSTQEVAAETEDRGICGRQPQTAYTIRESPEMSSRREPLTEGEEAARDEFFGDLAFWKKAKKLHFPLKPRIGNSVVDLYRLALAVKEQKAARQNVDWRNIAQALGYTWAEIPPVAAELQKFYQMNLELFQLFIDAYQRQQLEKNETPDDLEAPFEPLSPNLSPQLTPWSSPAALAGAKHSSDGIGTPQSEQRSKRRRLSRNGEVPSTPDEKIGVVRRTLQSHEQCRQSPDGKQQGNTHREAREESEGSEFFSSLPDRVQAKDTASSAQETTPRRLLETPSLRTHDSREFTPSQQLHLETLDSTHLSLHRGRRQRDEDAASEELGHDDRPIQRDLSVEKRVISDRAGEEARILPSDPGRCNAARRSLPASFLPSQNPVPATLGGEAQARKRQRFQSLRQERRPGSGDETADNEREIATWIEHYESLGYSRRIVVEALKCTTLTPGGLASHVMQSLQDGRGVPTHHRGIWTERDDKSLRLVDATDLTREPLDASEHRWLKEATRERDRLITKHGAERVALRRRFLEADSAQASRSHG